MGTFGLSAWFNAVIYLPLSVATVLAQTMAIFITVMAPFILGERVGAHRIGAVLIGFAGVVLLINPFSEADSSPLWGIGFAFGIATPFFGALMFIACLRTQAWHACLACVGVVLGDLRPFTSRFSLVALVESAREGVIVGHDARHNSQSAAQGLAHGRFKIAGGVCTLLRS